MGSGIGEKMSNQFEIEAILSKINGMNLSKIKKEIDRAERAREKECQVNGVIINPEDYIAHLGAVERNLHPLFIWSQSDPHVFMVEKLTLIN